jgi:hypothetical protein
MLLKDLAGAVDGHLIGDGDIEISSIEHDSRSVTSGALFVAVPGFTVDGHAYLGRAVIEILLSDFGLCGRRPLFRCGRTICLFLGRGNPAAECCCAASWLGAPCGR